MTRFIAGILAVLLVQLLGWPRIESALRSAGAHTQAAYTAAEKAVQESKVSK
jgi:F0F1-type ATP synthase membrane subunit b/b'